MDDGTKRFIINKGRCRLPMLFVKSVGDEIGVEMTRTGMIFSNGTKDDLTTILNDKSGRIWMPKELLRVYGDPDIIEVSYIGNDITRLNVVPIKSRCVKCGSTIGLVSIYKKEVYVCSDCIGKGLDLDTEKIKCKE